MTPLAIMKLPLQIITASTAREMPIRVFLSEADINRIV